MIDDKKKSEEEKDELNELISTEQPLIEKVYVVALVTFIVALAAGIIVIYFTPASILFK